jgi:hypothetical protein
MISCEYRDLAGNIQHYDLDSVVDIVRGLSSIEAGWIALIVFEPRSRKFIELRDSAPDPRGNSRSEAEEVESSYLVNNFRLSEKDVDSIKNNYGDWKFIDLT